VAAKIKTNVALERTNVRLMPNVQTPKARINVHASPDSKAMGSHVTMSTNVPLKDIPVINPEHDVLIYQEVTNVNANQDTPVALELDATMSMNVLVACQTVRPMHPVSTL
jgi:hypothetical protein